MWSDVYPYFNINYIQPISVTEEDKMDGRSPLVIFYIPLWNGLCYKCGIFLPIVDPKWYTIKIHICLLNLKS